ncbi:growth arrest and DNA-damage-inducible proteins-interacting protein 1 domain-containing protein [Purpureocillium lavendulum]|uniref:Growth arrest and DNA-damage-inducible proteins-interacting protein 1 domain-containing protein n=1 Tax=Purpureocillium lavendulum TaxID=1247861 RepID=A0AB34FWD2_9HYPO|nr:growth arrest and DNA-damage-inducible proteins-interacting protein 1 domain-containing protein [Purpureocillium lavendulum]
MTLPVYRQTASNNEQVLGREGDRDGVDVIVDLPTAEEDEALREEEMETIYQIRQTRRAQVAQRENLRQQRREARSRNDSGALADLRARSRAASNNSQIDDLRREVGRIQESRQRSVSSVSYADLGVARHDGTRLRASSNDSERMGLLSDAASIAVSQRSGAPSPALHRREQSAGSFVSVESDFPPSIRSRSRAGSRPDTPRLSGGGGALAGSSPELVEADLGVEDMPPPEYEDVALDETDEPGRSTTPLHGPPPDYPGPYRSASLRSEQAPTSTNPEAEEGGDQASPTGRGVGGIPQLPSLRISRLPEIVIEPSSAQPHAEPNSPRR